MILDTLDDIVKYAEISPNFETAVRWLQETDPEALEPGRTDIDGEKVYAVVSENRLEPKEPVKARNSPESRKTTSGSAKRTGRCLLSWRKVDSRFSCRERRMPPGFIRRKTRGLCLLRRPYRTGSSL